MSLSSCSRTALNASLATWGIPYRVMPLPKVFWYTHAGTRYQWMLSPPAAHPRGYQAYATVQQAYEHCFWLRGSALFARVRGSRCARREGRALPSVLADVQAELAGLGIPYVVHKRERTAGPPFVRWEVWPADPATVAYPLASCVTLAEAYEMALARWAVQLFRECRRLRYQRYAPTPVAAAD